MYVFTMRDLASGQSPVRAIDVAESAFVALAASGSVHLTENVHRTLGLLRAKGHVDSPQARALACSLCSACAGKGITHALSPSDAHLRWKSTEDVLEAWFSEPIDALSDALAKVAIAA